MKALEILGLACVDETFRDRLFNDTAAVIEENRGDLAQREIDGLNRITQNRYRVRAGAPRLASMGDVGDDGTVENALGRLMGDVARAIANMCPDPPCPWP
jgi:hypothetical protein